jgi:hypothetical protein
MKTQSKVLTLLVASTAQGAMFKFDDNTNELIVCEDPQTGKSTDCGCEYCEF